jgi:hypothetical protein
MTYCTWYKAPGLSSNVDNRLILTDEISLILNSNAVGGNNIRLTYDNGQTQNNLDVTNPISLNYLQNGNWHSIIVKIKANEYIKIFVDAISVGMTAHSGSLINGTPSYALNINKQGFTNHSQIGRTQIINGLLSDDEISSLIINGYSASYQNGIVIADWKWKGNGNDFTGNGYTLTALGSVTYVDGPLQSATLTSSLAGI